MSGVKGDWCKSCLVEKVPMDCDISTSKYRCLGLSGYPASSRADILVNHVRLESQNDPNIAILTRIHPWHNGTWPYAEFVNSAQIPNR